MKRTGLSLLVLALVWASMEAGLRPAAFHPALVSRRVVSAAPAPREGFAVGGKPNAGAWMNPLGVFADEVMQQAADLIGVRSFAPESQPDGSGIVVAMIGSGVDPGHRDLQRGPGAAAPKIVDWMDFSGEGLVETEPVASSGGWVDTRYGRFRIGGLRSAGGAFRLGVLREESLDPAGAVEQDLNGNGTITDVFAVLVCDHLRKGVYSRVYVDTNQNRDFTDEVPLDLYSQTGAFSRFRDRTGAVNPGALHFVVGDLAQDGSYVRLGFDSLGTGTFLAGLVAAGGVDPGGMGPGGTANGMRGVAPGASIMSLKALDSSGRGSRESLCQAIIYASKHGARVLLVDVGAAHLTGEELQSLRELTADVVSRHNVIVLFAAGDGGPGLETSRSPGDSVSSLTIGGVTGDSKDPQVWRWSAIGPTVTGGWAPDVVAPIAAVSTVPVWFSRSGYALGRSTTVSSAYAAGCAALVLQACDSAGVSVDAYTALAAFVESGIGVRGALAIEQGGGIINAARAFDLLRSGLGPPMPTVAEEPGRNREGGVLARGFTPSTVRFYVANLSGRNATVEFRSDADWVKPQQERLLMPPVGERGLLFEYGETPMGLSSAVVYGVDEKTGLTVFRTRHGLICPRTLSFDGSTQLESGDILAPGERRRHFLLVSPGMTQMEVTAQSSGEGEAWIQLIGPEGNRVYMAQIAPGPGWRKVVVEPEAGVWEAVVFGDEGNAGARVTLAARAEGLTAAPWPPTLSSAKAPGDKARLMFGLANHLNDMTVRLVPSRIRAGLSHDLVNIPAGQSLNKGFTITEGVSRLYIGVSHASSRDASIRLYLHQYDREAGWKEIASSPTQAGPSGTIDIPDPPPGAYMVYVESGQAGMDVQCELVIGLFEREPAVTLDGESVIHIGKGKVVPVSLLVDYSLRPGAGDRRIQIVDEKNGALVACLPLTLAADASGGLLAHVGGSAPDGKRYVTISLESGSFGPGIRMGVMVDGRTYALSDGRVTIPLRAPGEAEITLLLRGKPVMSKTLVIEDLPWNPANTPEPGTDPEKEVLRRSLMRRLGF